MSKIKDIKNLPVQNQQDYVYLIDNDSVTKTEADNTTVEINVVNTTDTTFEKVANINNENLFSARENNKKYVKKFHTLKIEKEITSSSPGYVYVMIPEIANVKFNEGDSDKYKLYKMMKERGWNYYPAHGKYFRKDENALHDISFLYPYQYPETGEYHYMMAYIYETSNGGHNTVYMPFCDFAEYENNLSFTALEDNSTITLEKIGEPDAVNLIYSTKKTGWENLIINETVITLKQGETVYIKGNNATFSKDKDNYYHFAMTGRIRAGGNINKLLSKDGNVDTLLDSCYIQLFQNCTSLVSTPDLPAKVLQSSCYRNMFAGCTSLEEVTEELPADKILGMSYYEMFLDCTSLKYPPKIAATYCGAIGAKGMFKNCSSLLESPELFFEQVNTSGCTGMFAHCTSLIKANPVHIKEVSMNSLESMFWDCASLEEPPVMEGNITMASDLTRISSFLYMFDDCISLKHQANIKIDILGKKTQGHMYDNCVSLTEVQDLGATELADSCYTNMFVGCSNINKIEVNFTNWLDGQTADWVNGVAKNGTFICPQELPIEFGEDRIPVGWTVLTK